MRSFLMGKNITPKGIKNIYFYLIIFITKRKHKFTASAQQGTTEKMVKIIGLRNLNRTEIQEVVFEKEAI